MKKILVVGNSKKAKEIAVNLSNVIKLSVEVALNGNIGLFKIQSKEYAMIFISDNLKVMTGNTVINYLCSNNKSKNSETPYRLVQVN
tara:strand:+ start:2773 stop:3033 length:261 start_codon:yes stop_codon:yes gene_type:complete